MAASSSVSDSALCGGGGSGSRSGSKPLVLLMNPGPKFALIEPALQRGGYPTMRLWELSPCEIRERARSVLALVGYAAPTSLLDELPALQIIASPSVGIDKIDLATCARRRIAVVHNPDIPAAHVADHALLLMLACSRRLCPAHRLLQHGLWPDQPPLTSKVSGKRVGIVGLGRIGLAIAKRVEAFGCTVSYHGRSSNCNVSYMYYRSVVDIASNSDFLFISCPLTQETRLMIGRDVLDALGPCGILINVGRGAIVNEEELIKALNEGRLGGAGLDVFKNEPNVPQELLSMDNVVLTPHIGSDTLEGKYATANLVVSNLDAHFAKQLT